MPTVCARTRTRAVAHRAPGTMRALIDKCVAGASVHQLCVDGDALIVSLTGAVYKGKMAKGTARARAHGQAPDRAPGIAFPTSVSVNHCACHYAPAQDDGARLQVGDMVKLELGVHLDTFPVLVAHTLVVGGAEAPATGRVADILLAAHTAVEASLRVVRAGSTSTDAVRAIQGVLDAFGCSALEGKRSGGGGDTRDTWACAGCVSFQVGKDDISGAKEMVLNPTPEQRRAGTVKTFEQYEVYAVDIAVSTGEGKVGARARVRPRGRAWVRARRSGPARTGRPCTKRRAPATA